MKKTKKKSTDLEFISQIKRDGSGTIPVKEEYIKYLDESNHYFNIFCLSLSEKTYIANGFNSFIVRLKP